MYKDDKGKPQKDDDPKRSTGRRRASKARTQGAADSPRTPRIRPKPEPHLSRSLEYGVAILESFSSEHQTLGIADISEIVGISRSTTHRYAMTLVALGYLEQDSTRKLWSRGPSRWAGERCDCRDPSTGLRSRGARRAA